MLETDSGGAPCNVVSMLTQSGRETAFIGKVADDGFGHQLEQALVGARINTSNLQFDQRQI